MEILVATSGDFALLRNGRPVAGGAWDDVLHVRAFRAGGPGDTVAIALRLRGGAEFLAHDDAPGWDDFLDAAESALPGMVRRGAWVPAVQAAHAAPAVVLFARDDRAS